MTLKSLAVWCWVAALPLLCACSDNASSSAESDDDVIDETIYDPIFTIDTLSLPQNRDSVFKPVSDYEPILKPSKILSLVNAKHGKILFREELTSQLIYWNLDKDSIYAIENGIDAYHPEISPNGKWVAFCTRFEGLDGPSELYVQNLENGKIVSLNFYSAVVPRWRILADGDTAITFVDDADLTQHESWITHSTWMVKFCKGRFAMPTKIFDGAFTNVSEDFRFAVAGGASLINRKISIEDGDTVAVDSLWYQGDQVCNLSLVKDGSLRTSFLDMSGTMGKEFTGDSSYMPHQYIFVMDSTGELIQSVRSPEDFAFDGTEWLKGNLQIASLSNFAKDLYRDRIVLVNMETGSITELLSGGDMLHPAFWYE